jgi:hypothetical protein
MIALILLPDMTLPSVVLPTSPVDDFSRDSARGEETEEGSKMYPRGLPAAGTGPHKSRPGSLPDLPRPPSPSIASEIEPRDLRP